jgi:glycosyltransferase involved in cell wall biosynthesis
MTGVRVSVVTPFHNTAEYLEQCIASVLAQTLSDFEYLLVNNGSTDGAGEIARTWAARDSRIRVIDQPVFLGQVENYNSALTLISPGSAYVKIVQADDTIVPECLERMVAVGDMDSAVAIIGSCYVYGEWVLFTGVPANTAVHDGRSICRRQLLSHNFFMGNPTTLMYRAAMVRTRSPFFELGHFHEDTELCFDVLRSSLFGFVPQVLSFVRVDNEEGSVTGTRRDYDWFLALRYTMLRRFGSVYLTPRELWPVEAAVTLTYWWKLIRAGLLFRGAGYFAFHRARLAEMGEVLSPLTILAWPSRVAVGFIAQTARALVGRPS